LFGCTAIEALFITFVRDFFSQGILMRKEPATGLLLARLFTAERAGIGLDEIAAKFEVNYAPAFRPSAASIPS
jgi:hypothetical protein